MKNTKIPTLSRNSSHFWLLNMKMSTLTNKHSSCKSHFLNILSLFQIRTILNFFLMLFFLLYIRIRSDQKQTLITTELAVEAHFKEFKRIISWFLLSFQECNKILFTVEVGEKKVKVFGYLPWMFRTPFFKVSKPSEPELFKTSKLEPVRNIPVTYLEIF